jgi:hypothetical protein
LENAYAVQFKYSREAWLTLLAGLSVTACEKSAPSVSAELPSASAKTQSNTQPAVSARELPAPSASASGAAGGCAPGGCAPGACGGNTKK